MENYFKSCRVDSLCSVVDVMAWLRAGGPKERNSMFGRSKSMFSSKRAD